MPEPVAPEAVGGPETPETDAPPPPALLPCQESKWACEHRRGGECYFGHRRMLGDLDGKCPREAAEAIAALQRMQTQARQGKAALVIRKRSHRHSARVTPEMVKGYRIARAWIRDHMEDLLSVGWDKRKLYAAGRFKYPCGAWGLAWAGPWTIDEVDVSIRPDGAVAFTWLEAGGRKVTQTQRPTAAG